MGREKRNGPRGSTCPLSVFFGDGIFMVLARGGDSGVGSGGSPTEGSLEKKPTASLCGRAGTRSFKHRAFSVRVFSEAGTTEALHLSLGR
jgi:hypothetical protein